MSVNTLHSSPPSLFIVIFIGLFRVYVQWIVYLLIWRRRRRSTRFFPNNIEKTSLQTIPSMWSVGKQIQRHNTLPAPRTIHRWNRRRRGYRYKILYIEVNHWPNFPNTSWAPLTPHHSSIRTRSFFFLALSSLVLRLHNNNNNDSFPNACLSVHLTISPITSSSSCVDNVISSSCNGWVIHSCYYFFDTQESSFYPKNLGPVSSTPHLRLVGNPFIYRTNI